MVFSVQFGFTLKRRKRRREKRERKRKREKRKKKKRTNFVFHLTHTVNLLNKNFVGRKGGGGGRNRGREG